VKADLAEREHQEETKGENLLKDTPALKPWFFSPPAPRSYSISEEEIFHRKKQ